jgi:Holliday junction resolvase-like predicted endonuclease
MKNVIKILMLVGVSLSLFGCIATKEGTSWRGEKIMVKVSVPYNAKNEMATRNQAIEKGKKEAIKKAVGIFIADRNEDDIWDAVEKRIMVKYDDFIRSYRVIDEYKQGSNYVMNVQVILRDTDLSTEVDSLKLAAPKMPKIMIFPFYSSGESFNTDDIKNALSSVFEDKGYRIITSKMQIGINETDLMYNQAQKQRAVFMLVATASVYKLEQLGNLGMAFSPYSATVKLELFSTDKQKNLMESESTQKAVNPNANIAAKKAISLATVESAKELIKPLETMMLSGADIEVKVDSLDGLEQLGEFQQMLLRMDNVRSISLNRYSKGTAYISVKTNGLSGEEFAAMILRRSPFAITAKSFSQYKVDLVIN